MRSPFAAAKARAAARRAKRASGSDPAFDAFISYSHAGDAELAKAIQIGLHRFARPWHRLRALRVFRDQASLATDPDLWGSIPEALLGARYLTLLASPAAARSEWVTPRGTDVDEAPRARRAPARAHSGRACLR